ncbi:MULTISPECIES: hypothetical protein [unclassified Methylobacterium]|jgi:hypothetical protein|uniref:hypothetical protein n=1 Tax=unclassified Methylobacterium TaxID=2615210 RepID=UPI001354B16D|nr:hypothetical protein [Methylobacterium sp. 2A]MWV20590.1 hypothetical protein [Methylobacterium sp. 2A]
MDQDTPEADRTARTIAENVYAAYWQQAQGTTHPQTEQTLLARLVEAIRPEIPGGSPGAIIAAANAVLDALEQRSPGIRGPRVSALNRADGTVAVGPAGG